MTNVTEPNRNGPAFSHDRSQSEKLAESLKEIDPSFSEFAREAIRIGVDLSPLFNSGVL